MEKEFLMQLDECLQDEMFLQRYREYAKKSLGSKNMFLTKILNIDVSKIKTKEHSKEELSHYSEKTIDYLYLFPHGWSEL